MKKATNMRTRVYGVSCHCLRASCRSSDPSRQRRGAWHGKIARAWSRAQAKRVEALHMERLLRPVEWAGSRLSIYARHALQIVTFVAL